MYKICVVTATRAEYGLLRPLLFRLKKNTDVELQLVVTGAHLSEKFGGTYKEIEADGFEEYSKIFIHLDDDSKTGMAVSTGVATEKFAKLFGKIFPDMVIILGDRYEMLGVATAAHLIGIPIAHMCGGDVTEGAVDDAIRHCITKLSYLHFPGCEESANRIIQMGESPDRVFNVGEPGIENCLNLQLLSPHELAEALGFNGVLHDFCVVTFHPVTMEDNTAEQQLYELISAMDSFPGMSYIVTKANADAGGRTINNIWDFEAKKRENWLLVNSLGILKYLSAVKYSKMVIGNSSSGLVEVPAFGIPTVNIGDRQKGRIIADSVICCEPMAEQIEEAMKKALSADFRERAKHVVCPFGDGHTSELVEKHILDFCKNKSQTMEKKFYEILFSERM